MRLSTFQIQTNRDYALQYFGKTVGLWLFGSRVNDLAKGGDIDLYIEASVLNAVELVNAKLYFLRDLHKKLGEQKIDVVLCNTDNAVTLPIYQIAKQTAIQLL